MNKLIYVFIISYLLIAGCSNQYTGLGFPYSIYSIAFVKANIPKTSSDTSSVNLILKDSDLQQF